MSFQQKLVSMKNKVASNTNKSQSHTCNHNPQEIVITQPPAQQTVRD